MIHLTTGILVCGEPTMWCGTAAEIDWEARKVLNATEDIKKATCQECLAEREKVYKKYAEKSK